MTVLAPDASPAGWEPSVTIRPTARWNAGWRGQPRKTMLAFFVLWCAFIAFEVTLSDAHNFFRIYVAVLLVVVIPLGKRVRKRTRRVAGISATADTISIMGIRGKAKTVPRRNVTSLVRASWWMYRLFPPSMRIRSPNLLFLDDRGATLLRAGLSIYEEEEMQQLIQALAVPYVDRSGEPLFSAAFSRRYPGSMPWWMAHYLLATILGGLGGGVVGGGLAVAAHFITRHR